MAENFLQLFDPFTGQTLQPREGVVQGGNTTLTPETTETYTVGIVLTPKYIPGLTVTTDLYNLSRATSFWVQLTLPPSLLLRMANSC